MPDGIEMKVTVKGMRQVQQMLRRLAVSVSRGGGSTSLHARYAIIASQWIDRNFQQEGGLVGGWRALSPNTIVGRRKGSSVILQDTGLMRASFTPYWDDKVAIVGSADKKSLWHEKGTSPYTIMPTRRIFLAFPHAGGRPLGKATLFPSAERKFAAGTPFVFTKGPIQHPGLPARRMLPRQTEIMPAILKTTINYIREQERRGGE